MSIFTEVSPNTFLPLEPQPMPRTKATPPAAADTLEHQAAIDSDLEGNTSTCPKCAVEQQDLDGFGVLHCEACGFCTHASVNGGICGLCGQTGLEELPSFDDVSETRITQVTQAEALALLDAEPSNGHIPEGVAARELKQVRPSEQCRTPSRLGIGCTFEAFHVGPHSWRPALHEFVASADNHTLCDNCASTLGKDWHIQPEATPGELAQLRQQDEAEQPALPGTPEPEFNEYSVPVESAFESKDFMSAPGLRAIADAWITETEELSHLRGIPIRYFWKRRGGLKGGNPRLGNLQKPSGIVRYSLGHPTLLMWIAADHVRDLKLDHDKIRAAVLHELCKASPDPDDHSAYRVVGPDAEVFTLELQKCGLWSMDLREVGAHVKQLGLLDTLTLEPDQAADESEDDEAEE